jgi:hypothetical protein
MDARQERARRIEFDKFKSLIAQLRVYKTENPSEEKRTPQTWV